MAVPLARMMEFLTGTNNLLKRIDDFRFKYRFVSRAAAIKWLVAAALDAQLKPSPQDERTK